MTDYRTYIAYSTCLLLANGVMEGAPPPPPAPSLLGRPESILSSSGRYSPLATARIAHMARVVGSKATADGTRYFAATDRTLEGVKRDKDIVRQLAPQSLRSGDERVRKVLVFVDIERHMALRVPKGEEIRVGTVLIESRTAPDVDATISVADFTLIGIKNHENK